MPRTDPPDSSAVFRSTNIEGVEGRVNTQLLVSDASHFQVDYEINPYMHTTVQPNLAAAVAEHQSIVATHRAAGRRVEYVASAPECPDMVLTANAAVVRGHRAVLACGDLLLAGYGLRTDRRMHEVLARAVRAQPDQRRRHRGHEPGCAPVGRSAARPWPASGRTRHDRTRQGRRRDPLHRPDPRQSTWKAVMKFGKSVGTLTDRRPLAACGPEFRPPGWERRKPPVALVYRGPASIPGCPEAAAALLESSRWGFDVRYVGPDEDLPLSPRALTGATVYAQPGGGTLDDGYRHVRHIRAAIRQFVHSGGRYLGFCLGGYLAGATPGFALLPGDTDQYIASTAATVGSEDDTLVQVCWRGRPRTLYFQDGPYFWVRRDADVTVVATYPNGTIAALVTGFGAGRVGVVGPHPEATGDWYADAGLVATGNLGADLGLDLVDAVMRSGHRS
jgi:hypothetical protein